MEQMKETKEITSEYRMSQWAEIMRERAESGLSIVKYCEREGMPTNRYHYWQRRLRAAAKEIMREAAKESVPTGWREVTAMSESKGERTSGVRVEIGKCVVGVEKTTDMEILTEVCKALMKLC